MAYLIVDPVGRYPSEILPFLARFDRGAVAVFSTRARYLLWRDKWSRQLGRYVLDKYLLTGRDTASLAAEIAANWPHLEGVIPWDEESVLLGAELGERLGLGWNSHQVIERCRDKAATKEWLRQHSDLRLNSAAVVTDAQGAREFQGRLGRWPVVVKPTRSAGSTDVYFASDPDQLLAACQRVLESGDGEVLLEEYVGGREIAVNGIADRQGDLLVTDVWSYDRRTFHGVPNLYYETAKVSTRDPLFRLAGGYAAAAVEAVGLRRCPIHLELKIDGRGPCLIEIGARLAGGNLPVLASRCHGRSLVELAACHYLAELPGTVGDLDYEAYDGYEARVLSGIQSTPIQRIRHVHGADAVRALPSFAGFGLLRGVGAPAPLTRDLDSEAWEVYLLHRDPRQIALDATRVRQLLRYE